MNVEIRGNSVVISGYVNAVERLSRPIREVVHGRMRTFLERIKAGTFRNALKRNDNVFVLLNHNPSRLLASTGDGSAKLEEDSIGLRAEIQITDEEVVRKAKEGLLSGWSFGFRANADEMGTFGEDEIRTVKDIDLVEVSILDNTCTPAYYGTSIEARGDGMEKFEVRAEAFEEGMEESTETEETESIDLDALAEKVAKLVIEAMTTTVEEVEEEVEEEEEERSIDYSAYEERLKSVRR